MKSKFLQRSMAVFLLCGTLLCLMPFGVFAGYEADCNRIARKTQYGYSCLTTEGQRSIYKQIEDAVSKMEASIEVEGTVTADELAEANLMFLSDHPEYFWYLGELLYYSYSGSDNVVAIDFVYKLNNEVVTNVDQEEAALKAVVEEIVGSIPKGYDEYETAHYLHDSLIKRAKYVFTANDQTAYGALVEGEAVCAGYAHAYQMLMQEAGLDAWTVVGYSYIPGTSETIAHAWNLVWIKGKCFYVDATWDDQDSDLYHEYFIRTLEEYEDSHFPSAEFKEKLPECNHEKEDFFDIETGVVGGIGGIVSDRTDINDVIKYMDITHQGGYYSAKISFRYVGEDINAWIQKNQTKILKALGIKGANVEIGQLGNEVHITLYIGTPSTYTETEGAVQLNLNYTDSGLKKGKTYDLWVAYYSEAGQFLGYKCEKMELDSNMNAIVSAECPDDFANCRVMVLNDMAAPLCYAMELMKK